MAHEQRSAPLPFVRVQAVVDGWHGLRGNPQVAVDVVSRNLVGRRPKERGERERQRMLELGSYQTAWVWLHKMRRAMVRPGRDRLEGVVEMDETYVGGAKPGKRGRGALGKALVAVAVEDKGDAGMGRVRLVVIPDASQESLVAFATKTVVSGSTIRTDDWPGYGTLPKVGYLHTIVPSHELKIAHRTIALLKSWLAGTHQGAVSHQHLDYYLDEFTFRFNRRRANHRGLLCFRLLQNAIAIEPTTYRQMVKNVRGPKPSDHNG